MRHSRAGRATEASFEQVLNRTPQNRRSGHAEFERKSLDDLLQAVGRHRARFDREAQRLMAYPVRALVVEASWADLEQGRWRSDLTPAAALGSVLGWIALGLPVIMAGDHEAAGRFVSRLLYIAARRRWREARALVGCVLRTVSEES